MARKNPAAVQLGRKGGKASGKAKLKLSPEERAAIGKRLSEARWEQWLIDNPDKAEEAMERRRKRAAAAKKAKQ